MKVSDVNVPGMPSLLFSQCDALTFSVVPLISKCVKFLAFQLHSAEPSSGSDVHVQCFKLFTPRAQLSMCNPSPTPLPPQLFVLVINRYIAAITSPLVSLIRSANLNPFPLEHINSC